LPAAVLGRPEKITSWVLRMVFAISTEEPTTTGNDPNWTCIMGPYFWERAWRERCGSSPMRLRFPIIGQGFGPGGSLSLRRRRRLASRIRDTVASHAKA